MNTAVIDRKQVYHEVNSITGNSFSVIFGTGCLSALPVAELVHDLGLNISVCNRSVAEAVLRDAFDLLDECIFELSPARVFLNFGETDLRRDDYKRAAFLADYRRLVDAIRARSSCRIFLVSVLSEEAEACALNAGLEQLARETDCSFVDAREALRHEKPRLRLFSELTHYMREGGITFADAMHLCEA